MKTPYDKYYQTLDYFGDPYPELIAFFKQHPKRGRLLDLGCGQGRNAIPLARLGYEVTGIDYSSVGISQLNQTARSAGLDLIGIVADIYTYDQFSLFDFILLDSMFHFTQRDKEKETALIKHMLGNSKTGSIICFCIQNTGKKVQILNETIDESHSKPRLADLDFYYSFTETKTEYSSRTRYKLLAIQN